MDFKIELNKGDIIELYLALDRAYQEVREIMDKKVEAGMIESYKIEGINPDNYTVTVAVKFKQPISFVDVKLDSLALFGDQIDHGKIALDAAIEHTKEMSEKYPISEFLKEKNEIN